MQKLDMIKKIMTELLGEMEEGPEDFDSRLGKKKPGMDIEVMQLEPKKKGDDSNSDSYDSMDDENCDDEDGKNFDDLFGRISEMKRKKRG